MVLYHPVCLAYYTEAQLHQKRIKTQACYEGTQTHPNVGLCFHWNISKNSPRGRLYTMVAKVRDAMAPLSPLQAGTSAHESRKIISGKVLSSYLDVIMSKSRSAKASPYGHTLYYSGELWYINIGASSLL